MPAQIAARTVVLALAICAGLVATAQATTSATISPSLFPDRLGAKGALVFTIRYTGDESGVPSPVRRSVWRFPAGLSVEIPHLRSCTTARLRARGASGCPPQSQIGSGHALAEVHAGSQIITEGITLWVFVGPLRNIQPTFEILGQGYTPFDERLVFTGEVLPDRTPYGEDLVMSMPPNSHPPARAGRLDSHIVTYGRHEQTASPARCQHSRRATQLSGGRLPLRR
jgi:hypothetical protein